MGDQHLRFLHDLSELTVGGTMKLIENSRNYYVTQDGRVFSGIRDCVEIKINDYPVREYTQVSGNGRPPGGG